MNLLNETNVMPLMPGTLTTLTILKLSSEALMAYVHYWFNLLNMI